MKPGRVLVVGDVMRDIIVRTEGPIRRGTDQRAAIQTLRGGSGANQAAWLSRCGVPVRLLACVADRDLAAERTYLGTLGVEPALVGHPDRPTGQLIALIDADGERSFLTDRGANDALSLAALPTTILDDIAHLHISGYAFVGCETRHTARQLIARARAAGASLSFDPGSAAFVTEIGAPSVLALIETADVCVANEDEAKALTGSADVDEQLSVLNRAFDLVLLKQGAAGAVARHRDGRRWTAPAPAVRVVDTIGAGDAFLAGFLSGWRSSESIEASLARAVAIGSQTVTRAGGAPPSSDMSGIAV